MKQVLNQNLSSLVLGTAQLGLKYGIANKIGKPDQMSANAIVQKAWELGVREFDTAQAYGDSEQVLGQALASLGISDQVRVISKFAPSLNHLDSEELSRALHDSLQRLGVAHLYAMLLHREDMLCLLEKGLGETLQHFVRSNKVKKIGVSVYSPEKAKEALMEPAIDIVQLPSNIFDKRFIEAGVFELAAKMNKKIYVRSVYVQGLLLMSYKDVFKKNAAASTFIETINALTKEFSITRQELALGYLKAKAPFANIIFGAETREQIEENVLAWQNDVPETLVEQIESKIGEVQEKIYNPAMWHN